MLPMLIVMIQTSVNALMKRVVTALLVVLLILMSNALVTWK